MKNSLKEKLVKISEEIGIKTPRTCKIKYIGSEKIVECLETDPYGCEYANAFGFSWFCKCPDHHKNKSAKNGE